MNSSLAEQCVERLINSLNLRRGFKELWEKTEPYYQDEIRKEWKEIIGRYLKTPEVNEEYWAKFVHDNVMDS